ncbi:MAG: hypothetical protein GF364_20240 [Candidatus Lokiarchaeota archaeon]|nr:hypothetical protein [Candidatus Lokiarchaeota archaeon]
MNYLVSIFGGLILVFRVWLTQDKLREELQFRRLYLSRVVNFHTFMAMTLSFENHIFNQIVMTCWPVMILTSVWDYNFFKNFKKRPYWRKNKGWLLVERLTLHIPILVIGGVMYLQGFEKWFPRNLSFFPAIVGMFLVFIPFFLMDERWTKGYNYPQPLIMIVIMISSTIVLNIIIVFGIYHVDFSQIF